MSRWRSCFYDECLIYQMDCANKGNSMYLSMLKVISSAVSLYFAPSLSDLYKVDFINKSIHWQELLTEK